MTTASPRLSCGAERAAAALIVFIYGLVVLFVSPQGDFPVNDDWVYGESARLLAGTGKLDLGSTSAACFLHILLGAVACKLFGASYVVLRIMTICFGLVAALALFLALRELNINRRVAGLFTLVYAGNPLFLNLCFSFMTDVCALALTNLYLLLTLRGVRRNSLTLLLLSSLSLVCSIAVRQTAVVFALCNLAVLLVWRPKLSQRAVCLLLLVALPAACSFGLQWLLETSSTSPAEHSWFEQETARVLRELLRAPAKGLCGLMVTGGQVAFYLGLFCAPVLCGFLPLLTDLFKGKARIQPIWFTAAAAVVATTLTKLVAAEHRLMPFNQNLLRIPEVGSHNLMGITFPALAGRYRVWLTNLSATCAFLFLSVVGAGGHRAVVLAVRAFGWRHAGRGAFGSCERMRSRAAIAALCFTTMGAALGMVALQGQVMDLDRYYLMPLAPSLLCLALCWRWLRAKPMWPVSITLASMMAVYSVMATQDYMSWNRARWRAVAELESSGVHYKQIDGGPEYNFRRDPSLEASLILGSGIHGFANRGAPPRDNWRWWPIHGEDYIISFSPVPGYDVISRQPYWSGLSLSHHEVLVLKRADSLGGEQRVAGGGAIPR